MSDFFGGFCVASVRGGGGAGFCLGLVVYFENLNNFTILFL